MNSHAFRWREYTGADYFGPSKYTPTRHHEQEEPPTWSKYRSLCLTHTHFTNALKGGGFEERWQQRAWYAQQQDYRVQLDQLAHQILNPEQNRDETTPTP